MTQPTETRSAAKPPAMWWSPTEGFWSTNDGPLEGLRVLDFADEFRAYPPPDAVELVGPEHLEAALRERTAERDRLRDHAIAQEQTLAIVRAQSDDCVRQVDATLGHRYHTRGVHYSVPHVAEKAAAELAQLQARIDAALAAMTPACPPGEAHAQIAKARAALQGSQPAERTEASRDA
jgi:hypothetical protein